jgi:hypothetical protein
MYADVDSGTAAESLANSACSAYGRPGRPCRPNCSQPGRPCTSCC